MRSFFVSAFTLCLFVLLIGCQSSGSPATPKAVNDISLVSSAVPGDTNRNLWGYYQCVADLDLGTVAAIPARGAELHVNVTKPLNNQGGFGVEILPGTNPATGYFNLNVSITHPFPGQDGLSGFDVRGIMLVTGSLESGWLNMPGVNDPQLLNADGWTRWWNPTEFTDEGLLGYVPGNLSIQPPTGPPTATLNAYKLFGDGLLPSMDVDFLTGLMLTDPGGRAFFRSGNTNTRQYEIRFPVNGGPKIYFDYAIDASWAPPNPDPPVNLPGDFPMWANSLEAFIVTPEVTSNTLAGTPFGGFGSGELVLTVEVWDWQGWSDGSYDGEIGSVRLLSPFVDFDTPVVEKVDGFHFTTLTVTATGVPSFTGEVPVVIEIPAPGSAWKQGVQAGPDGEAATFAVFYVDIGIAECIGDENVNCDDSEMIGLQGNVTSAVCMPLDPSDYYVFEVPAGKVMEGTITLDNFNYSDNDMILYDGCPGDPIELAMEPGTITEVLELGNLEQGLFIISILPGEYAGEDVQPYTLSLDIHEAEGQCTLDTNNEYTTATPIGLTQTKTESVCAGLDLRDWFRITVPTDKVAGGMIYVENLGDGNINIRVYDSYPGPPTFWSVNPGIQSEMVLVGGLGPGNHYIEIYAQGSTPDGDRGFNLQIDLFVSEYDCTSGDGNDSYMIADPIEYIDVVAGTVCYPSDPDWFLFNVSENKALSGTITLSGSLTYDNDMFLYEDPAEAPVYSNANVGIDDEIMEIELLPTGTYYLKLIAHPVVGGGDQDYVLTMNLEEEAVGNFDFQVHAHIITRTDGSNPATSESKIQDDVDWADQFYSQWGGSFTLVDISYIPRTSWLAASTNEMVSCDALNADNSGPINVYYVNSFTNLQGAAAYAIMDCRYYFQTHTHTYIVMADSADHRTLAHEMGHSTAILLDMYLLDYYTCSQLYSAYCPYPQKNAYCDSDDQEWGNLMYWGVQNWTQPHHYHLSDYQWETPEKPILSQIENWTYFHSNYPDNFPN